LVEHLLPDADGASYFEAVSGVDADKKKRNSARQRREDRHGGLPVDGQKENMKGDRPLTTFGLDNVDTSTPRSATTA
jgi:hypothetical protein